MFKENYAGAASVKDHKCFKLLSRTSMQCNEMHFTAELNVPALEDEN